MVSLEEAKGKRIKSKSKSKKSKKTNDVWQSPRTILIGLVITILLFTMSWSSKTPAKDKALRQGLEEELAVEKTESTLQRICLTFEVDGKVQKVSMRKYTKKKADELGVSGYVMNTESGSVKGECCGTKAAIKKFKTWLSTKGSPKARIDTANFSNEESLEDDKFGGVFEIKKVTFSNGKQWAD